MNGCIFCKIATGNAAAEILFQDEDVIAFRDLSPQAPHHILVIPKRHIANLDGLEPEDGALAGKLLMAAAQVARDLGIADEGYRTVINCNRHGGQTVGHLHLHLLAGRQMHWPPG